MSERDEALKEAWDMPLVDLLMKVFYDEYIPGIHDYVSIERARLVDNASG